MSETISFEEALERSDDLLNMIANGSLSQLQIEEIVTELVASENGARGFFVNYLTTDYDFANSPSIPIIKALSSSPAIVSELLVKNLAMSTATKSIHEGNGDLEQAAGSTLVQQRSLNLLNILKLPQSSEKIAQLATTLQTGVGDYQSFIERWGYDQQQKEAIFNVLPS